MIKPVKEGEMSSRIDEALHFNQTALNLRAARQELIASNIANADTPNFKARDIDFASALKGALSATSPKLAMSVSAAAQIAGADDNKTVMGAPVKYRTVLQPSADGNTVDMDVERAQFADNALRYEASVKFISDDIKKMLTVIQG
jgi:flagellar basal-body rod protein FlgB